MNISEARSLYRTQITAYQAQQAALSKQKQALAGEGNCAQEAATLELSLKAVNDKLAEYQTYMEQLTAQWVAAANMVSAKQQGDAMSEYAKDLSKIMEVARRIMKGGSVPANDEKKLMEYSMELYQAAKNMGSLAKQREREEYDSLWEDEGKAKEAEDPVEAADHTEAFGSGPEIVDVAETMASVKIGEY